MKGKGLRDSREQKVGAEKGQGSTTSTSGLARVTERYGGEETRKGRNGQAVGAE